MYFLVAGTPWHNHFYQSESGTVIVMTVIKVVEIWLQPSMKESIKLSSCHTNRLAHMTYFLCFLCIAIQVICDVFYLIASSHLVLICISFAVLYFHSFYTHEFLYGCMMSLPNFFFNILQPHLILGLISQIIKVSSYLLHYFLDDYLCLFVWATLCLLYVWNYQ